MSLNAPTARKRPSPERLAWHKMRQRCFNPNATGFANWGGRGITICNRWLHGDGTLTGFECFLADVGPRPSPKHTIDRKDNDGNYEPDNVRWATWKEQAANRRPPTFDRVAPPRPCRCCGAIYQPRRSDQEYCQRACRTIDTSAAARRAA